MIQQGSPLDGLGGRVVNLDRPESRVALGFDQRQRVQAGTENKQLFEPRVLGLPPGPFNPALAQLIVPKDARNGDLLNQAEGGLDNWPAQQCE